MPGREMLAYQIQEFPANISFDVFAEWGVEIHYFSLSGVFGLFVLFEHQCFIVSAFSKGFFIGRFCFIELIFTARYVTDSSFDAN